MGKSKYGGSLQWVDLTSCTTQTLGWGGESLLWEIRLCKGFIAKNSASEGGGGEGGLSA
ncbi:hypothetical protein PSHT_08954 [Puccinia striiformis]|uniref:Uncharacterized protein n=1 Tax=Puccinia striiformis TaxID=27350 RepID=A0A2S4VJS4_9BASI|nr:hypothetical protein PSHT_08954 [Puccinia striiformis]